MIVTVAVVRMVQVTIYKIVDMIAMRDRFVAATRAMDVSSIMSGAAMVRRAAIWVVVAHLNAMFVHVIGVRMVKMTIVEIVHVVAVPNGDVAAIRSMYVVVVGMMRKIASAHLMGLSSSVLLASVCDSVLDEFEDIGSAITWIAMPSRRRLTR